VITGFNTDIEHDGVVYHVQTEDKGLDTPIILSLVYSGGAILASKRSPYEDLIAEGFSDEVLSERLKRQHRLICAAIHSGRIDDLKKMGARPPVDSVHDDSIELEDELRTTPPVQEVQDQPADQTIDDSFEIEYLPASQEWTPPPPSPPVEVHSAPEFEPEPSSTEYAPQNEAYSIHDLRRQQALDDVEEDAPIIITLLEDEELYSGDPLNLRVLITTRIGEVEKPLANAAVSVKILGTTFRPLIYSLKTQRDGLASVSTQIPQFTSGRAAVLVRVVAKDQAAELRRIIHPSR
jgi:hypothetical protein